MRRYGNKNRIIIRHESYMYNPTNAQVLTACKNCLGEVDSIRVDNYQDNGYGFSKVGDPLWFGMTAIDLLVTAKQAFTK